MGLATACDIVLASSAQFGYRGKSGRAGDGDGHPAAQSLEKRASSTHARAEISAETAEDRLVNHVVDDANFEVRSKVYRRLREKSAVRRDALEACST